MCSAVKSNSPRRVIFIPNNSTGASALASFAAITALRRCANDVLSVDTTWSRLAGHCSIVLRSTDAGVFAPNGPANSPMGR